MHAPSTTREAGRTGSAPTFPLTSHHQDQRSGAAHRDLDPAAIAAASNLTGRLLLALAETPLDRPAAALQRLHWRCWQANPELVTRLGSFLPIGAVSTVIQAALLIGLTRAGLNVFVATLIAVQVSVLFNFTANWLVTWRDRFVGFTPRQQRRWFLPLFLIFDLTTPTVWLKIAGITAFERLFGLPLVLCWLIFEIVGTAANYLGADRLSFGAMVSVISRFDAESPPARARGKRPAWAAMRPAQWLKNVFVLAALPFALATGTPRDIAALLGLTIAFCAAASSVYLVNDLLDRDRDRLHPTKRMRPIASGALPATSAWLLTGLLTTLSLGIAFVINPFLPLWLIAYLGLAHGYTIVGKQVAYLDVALVGAMYGLRVGVGFAAAQIALQRGWTWVALATLLAVAVETGKRWSEWRLLGPGPTRAVLSSYSEASLRWLFAGTAGVTVALYALTAWRLSPLFTLSTILVIVGFICFWKDLNRLDHDAHPQEVLLADRRLAVIFGGFALWFAYLAMFGA